MTFHDSWAGGLSTPGRRPAAARSTAPATKPETLAHLALQLSAGDDRALASLFEAFGDLVHTVALAVVRDHADANDVTNFTFAKAWRERERFDLERGTLNAWLTTIARNRALDVVRARSRREKTVARYVRESEYPACGEGDRPSPAPDALRLLEEAELRDVLRVALSALPAAQRTVIELAYLGDHSHTDVSVQLGVPLGTVKTRARTGLRRMREVLAQDARFHREVIAA